MSKLVLLLSFLGIGILLIVGLIDPNNSVVWLASTAPAFSLVRIAMMAVLLALLVTNPPRSIILRIVIGLFSIGLISWALRSTYDYHMKLLDTFSLLEVGLSAGISVLEQGLETAKQAIKPAAKKPTV
jgi:hypothetical protein